MTNVLISNSIFNLSIIKIGNGYGDDADGFGMTTVGMMKIGNNGSDDDAGLRVKATITMVTVCHFRPL